MDPPSELRPSAPGDSFAEDRMFARVSEAMFGSAPRAPRVGPYFVLEPLGSGAMGVVYAAFDEDLDRRVALKLLHKRHSESEIAHQRLLREARALARLSHPNVVTVHGVGDSERGVYIAMEFVEGETLGAWMQRSQPLARILDVFTAAGRGLVAAHAVGLVHRDFKPANVLMGADEVPRVADFGLARATESASTLDGQSQPRPATEVSPDLTGTGAVLGTPVYMAPEQHEGREVGPAADQFAFCVSLYEAVCGRLPFDAKSLPALEAAKSDAEIRRFDSQVPRWLVRVIERGLAPDPARRFDGMDALLRAISRGRASTRRRWRALGLAAVLVAAGSGAWVARGSTVLPVPQPPPDPCRAATKALEAAWSPARQQALTSKPALASAHGHLAQFADKWRETTLQSCRDHASGEESDALFEARRECLARALDSFDHAAALLEGDDPDVLGRADAVARSLRVVENCRFEQAPIMLRYEALDPEDRARAQAALADADQVMQLRSAGKRDEATRIARRLWAEIDAQVDPHARAEIARVAALEFLEGDEREEALRRALEDSIRSGHYQNQGFVYADLGDHVRWQGRTREARGLFRAGLAAMDAFRSYEGGNRGIGTWAHLISGRLHNLLGLVALEDHGDYEEAKRQFMAALTEYEPVYDDDPQRLMQANNNLGLALVGLRRLGEARERYQRALALALENHGDKGYAHAVIANNIASIDLELGNLEAAEASARRAIGLAVRPDGPATLGARYTRAMVELVRDDVQAAHDTLEEVAAIATSRPAHDSQRAAIGIAQARVEVALGRPSEALTRLDAVVAGLGQRLPPPHELHAEAETVRASALLALERPEEALAAVTSAVEQLEQTAGVVTMAGARTLALRGQLRASVEDDSDAAIADLQRALDVLPAAHPEVVRLACDLSEVARAAGRSEVVASALDRASAARADPPASTVQAERLRVLLTSRP